MFQNMVRTQCKSSCVVYGVVERVCVCSHIIPKSLINVFIPPYPTLSLLSKSLSCLRFPLIMCQSNENNMKIGIKHIRDEWDPSLGLLLSRDIDFHFSLFELSFYASVSAQFRTQFDKQDANAPRVHLFRSLGRRSEKYFAPSAWGARGRLTALEFDTELWILLRWHYKHSLINCWGSTELVTIATQSGLRHGG